MRRTLNPLVLVAAVLILIALPAAAADNGFYIGGSVGQAAVNTGELGEIEIDDEATGYKVFAGVRMLTFLAIEGSYRDLGSVTDDDSGISYDADVTGYDLQAMAMLPLGIADIFAKAGLIEWESEFSGPGGSVSRDGNDPVYGAGFQFRFSSFAVRGEIEYFDIESTDEFYMYSIGASYTF